MGRFNNPVLKHLPNAITVTNMVLGLSVIFLVIGDQGRAAVNGCCLLILLGAVLDYVDGRLARYLQAASDFGKQMDSFADLVTFGLAPVALLWSLEPAGTGAPAFLLLAVYPLAGAFRLARYNTGDYRDYFLGLPITLAGTGLAVYILVYENFLRVHKVPVLNVISVIILLVLSLLMVSNVKVPRRLSLGGMLNHHHFFSLRMK